MPHAEEPMYCAQQIRIPPELPDILKQFTKAAIRTQPADILLWAAEYFEALDKGEPLPVKERLDFKLGEAIKDSPLTQSSLLVLHKQLGDRPVVELSKVEEKWNALSLPKEKIDEIMRLGSFGEDFEWLHFLALACSTITPNITLALRALCEILTKDLDGGPARIDFNLFKDLYFYLASVDGEIPRDLINSVIDSLKDEAEKQKGMIGPRNFMSDSCPPLSPK